MREKIRATLAAVLGIPLARVKDDASVMNIAEWDSLKHIRLVMALEEQLGLVFDDEAIGNMTSLDAIVREAEAARQ